MSTYETMKQAYDKTYEIKSSTTTVAKTLQEMVNEEIQEVRRDITLSPHGQEQAIEEIRDRYGKQFIEQAKKMRDEFDKNVVKARINAESLLNEPPKRPVGAENDATFARKLNDLKMSLMLETD